jgi:hypothetical protein
MTRYFPRARFEDLSRKLLQVPKQETDEHRRDDQARPVSLAASAGCLANPGQESITGGSCGFLPVRAGYGGGRRFDHLTVERCKPADRGHPLERHVPVSAQRLPPRHAIHVDEPGRKRQPPRQPTATSEPASGTRDSRSTPTTWCLDLVAALRQITPARRLPGFCGPWFRLSRQPTGVRGQPGGSVSGSPAVATVSTARAVLSRGRSAVSLCVLTGG